MVGVPPHWLAEEQMIADLPRSMAFATHAHATHHLERVGFVFMGAPDRWHRIRNGRTIYARIIVVATVFQICFEPSKTA
jgi:hypothetical protein